MVQMHLLMSAISFSVVFVCRGGASKGHREQYCLNQYSCGSLTLCLSVMLSLTWCRRGDGPRKEYEERVGGVQMNAV